MLRSNVSVDVASIENRKLASLDYMSAIHASSKDNDNTVEGTKFDEPRPQKDYTVDKIKIARMEEKTRWNITQSVSLQVTLLRRERIGNRTSDDESVGRHWWLSWSFLEAGRVQTRDQLVISRRDKPRDTRPA